MTDDSALYFRYDASGDPIGFTYKTADAETEYFYVKNLQGDILKVIDSNGTVCASYTYDAWGNILSSTGELAAINPLRYRGYYYDTETGLYYVSSRYYDPEICRFINADDAECLGAEGELLSYNLFAYCLNNPVNRTDVNGNWSLPNWAKVAIGAVATVAAVAVTVATGGAAAPVLIGVAMSTAVSGAVGYATGGVEGLKDGLADGFMTGGLFALGCSAIRGAVKMTKIAKNGLTIGKTGQFEKIAEMTHTEHYSGLKEYRMISRVLGKDVAREIGWWQNKTIVNSAMMLKATIYDCGGKLTGAYAKEVALTKGYEFLCNIWVM